MTYFEGEWRHRLQARFDNIRLSCPSCWSSGVGRHRQDRLPESEVEARFPLPGQTSDRAVSLDARSIHCAACALPPGGTRTVRHRRRPSFLRSFLATATIGRASADREAASPDRLFLAA
jgi:hypothetical protein